MPLLKFVVSHLDLKTSLFCPATVNWPMARRLTLSEGDKSPGSLLKDARVALQMRTEHVMKTSDLRFTDDETGD